MPIDAGKLKDSLDIVSVIGVHVELTQEGSGFKGLCPFHVENTPSFNVNPELNSYHCFGCGAGGDVIDFIQKNQGLDFHEALEFLSGEPTSKETGKKKSKSREKPNVVPLSLTDAKPIYSKNRMQELADYIFKNKPKKFIKAWPYKNEKGNVELVASRFEDEQGRKDVLSFYYNGKSLAMKNYPVLLFGRDRLNSDPNGDVLFVSGEKCAMAAEAVGFIGVTTNGGEKKIKDADLAPLAGRNIYIWPDDDPPGETWGKFLSKKFPDALIVPTITEMRKTITKGADIADAVELYDRSFVAKYIYEKSKLKENTLPETKSWPFEILGVADDGRAYFISETDRMLTYNLPSLTKTQLVNLANVDWWRENYDGFNKENSDNAASDIIHISSMKDFDPDRMRGRGAWRETDGRICYHDGKNLVGEFSKERIYLRRSIKNIGLDKSHATPTDRDNLYSAVMGLTFSTFADCVRTLSWSILAPFAGALPWRPAGLMTAASGAGKTTIVNSVIKPLSLPIVCSGGESTSAGIRQRIGVDSCAVVVEEAEADTQKKRQNRDETFSLMRQSTSDDSPDVLKGTIDGKGMRFTLRSMFFFVSISPEIESEADENRIFRVKLEKPNYSRQEWLKRESILKSAITPEICASIRSFTWSNLKKIILLAERVTVQAQLISGVDNRTVLAESLLLSAFMIVFQNKIDPSESDIKALAHDFYRSSPMEPPTNETVVMLDNYLDHIIRDGQESYTIRDLLDGAWTRYISGKEVNQAHMRRIAGLYGAGLDKDGNIAIAKNHPEIMKILEKGRGYHHQLLRHPGLISEAKYVNLGNNTSKSCVIIKREEENADN